MNCKTCRNEPPVALFTAFNNHKPQYRRQHVSVNCSCKREGAAKYERRNKYFKCLFYNDNQH